MPDRNALPRTQQPDAKPGWKLRLEERLNLLDPVVVVVYRSFGMPDALRLRGRVIEKKGIEGSTEETSVLRNVLNTIRRLESDEIPGAHLRAHFQGKVWEARSDAEGYFMFDIDPDEPLAPGWHPVKLELVESVGEPEERFVTGHVLVPSPDAEFAVISDLDDTVIKTHNTALLQEMTITFGKGASQRKPFPGIPAFYRALAAGPDDRGENPIFYISRSGWNLYDLFDEFMTLNGIPAGPLFLTDTRIIEDRSAVMHSENPKFENIDLMLRAYPELPFILIGDSGMKDPELYQKIVAAHPGRIKAIYIHDVSGEKRDREVHAIADQLAESGVPLVHAASTVEAAGHACEQGYISPSGLEEVRRDAAGKRG